MLKSRQAVDRQQRIVASIGMGVGLVLASLAIFGWITAGNEKNARAIVDSSRLTATFSANNVLTQEAKVNGERLRAATTASANAQEALRQANIALSRQLAAQAQQIYAVGDARQELAVLLAALSMRNSPIVDSAEILQNNVLAYPIAELKHQGFVESVAFSPDGKKIVSGSQDKTARVWEVATGKEIAKLPHDSGVRSKEISRMTHISDTTTHSSAVESLAFSPDGKYVVSGSTDHTARVWKAATNREEISVGYQTVASSVAFSPDRKYKAVVNNEDGSACVWEVNPEKKVACVTHQYAPSSIAMVGNGTIAFSPNGKYVISSGDYTARVWDPTTGNEIARMTHENCVDSVAFSPDGKYAASGDRDGIARVWEVTTGKEVAHAHHDTEVNFVAFSLDGRYVISGNREGITHTWAYLPADLIADACSRVTRNLTRMEWKLYIGDTIPYEAVCKNLPIEPETALITPTP